jgi:hypothetical protein
MLERNSDFAREAASAASRAPIKAASVCLIELMLRAIVTTHLSPFSSITLAEDAQMPLVAHLSVLALAMSGRKPL